MKCPHDVRVATYQPSPRRSRRYPRRVSPSPEFLAARSPSLTVATQLICQNTHTRGLPLVLQQFKDFTHTEKKFSTWNRWTEQNTLQQVQWLSVAKFYLGATVAKQNRPAAAYEESEVTGLYSDNRKREAYPSTNKHSR